MANENFVSLYEATPNTSGDSTRVSWLQRVLNNEVGVNVKNDNGELALHQAISEDADIEILRQLMGKGASLNMANKNGKTPLECLRHGSYRTALNLLKLMRIYDFRDEDGNTLLHLLMDRLGDKIWGIVRPDDMEVGDIGNSEQDQLIELFWNEILKDREQYGIDLNTINDCGNTPLHIATNFWPSLKNLEFMLNYFDDINPLIANNDGNTFLHAYFNGYSSRGDDSAEFTDRLLRGEFRNFPMEAVTKLVNSQNKDLYSPLHVYVKEHKNFFNSVTLQRIVEAGADVNLCSIGGETPLHCVLYDYINDDNVDELSDIYLEDSTKAVEEQNSMIVRFLGKNGADMNVRNKLGESLLFLAHHKPTVDTILEFGGDINLRDKFGHTPLISQICRPKIDIEIIELLLNKGANINAVDSKHSNILHYVAWHGLHPDILAMLSRYGATITFDKNKNLPCHVAYQRGNRAVFEKLCSCDKSEHTQKEQFNFQKESIDMTDLDTPKSDHFQKIFDRFRCFRGETIHELLSLPSFAPVIFLEEAKMVKEAVNDLVRKICHQFAKENEFLSAVLIESGSVGENTKVCLPDEFDFLCIFDKLGEICCIDETKSENNSGYVYLRLKEEFSDKKSIGLFNEEGYLDTFEVRGRIQEALDDMFLKRDVFCHQNISLVRSHFKGENCPTFRFAIRWVGCTYKDMNIDIDIVPSCKIKGWWPKHSNLHLFHSDVKNNKEDGAILILHTDLDDLDDNNRPRSKQRISAYNVERKQILSLPQIARDAYLVSKIICDHRICPGLRIPYKIIKPTELITSYMLKNCMFHVFHAICESRPIQSNTGLNSELYSITLHDFVLQIFYKLIQCTYDENLPSFVFPWQNIFTFNVIDGVSQNHENCILRRAFTKIILEILGESQDFKDIDIKLFEVGDTYMIDDSDVYDFA